MHDLRQPKLLRVLSEDMVDNPHYRALMRGEPLSLCPNGSHRLSYNTFVPVLQRTGDDQWQLGLPQQGRYALIMGDLSAAIQQVWRLYAEWVQAELCDGER